MTKLEKALVLIRDECRKHECCVDCDLYSTEVMKCGIQREPEVWKLKVDVDPYPNRVFYVAVKEVLNENLKIHS